MFEVSNGARVEDVCLGSHIVSYEWNWRFQIVPRCNIIFLHQIAMSEPCSMAMYSASPVLVATYFCLLLIQTTAPLEI